MHLAWKEAAKEVTIFQARMFYELSSGDRGEGCATGQPRGIGSEAYLSSTSQGEPVLSVVEGTPGDARKDRRIRGRSHAVA
jgi:hypothetical protein